MKDRWALEGFVLQNTKVSRKHPEYVAYDGNQILYATNNLLDAYIFTNKDEANRRIPGLCRKIKETVITDNEYEKQLMADPKNWKAVKATRSVEVG